MSKALTELPTIDFTESVRAEHGSSPTPELSSPAAIVLAGSYAWTNSSFEQLRARPLLPIAQSPMIVHVLRSLSKNGISDVTICANGSTGAMKSYFAAAPPTSIAVDYYEDKSPRGAAGCLRDAAQRTDADTLIVTECSMQLDVSLDALLAKHRQSGAALTIAVSREERMDSAEFLNPIGLYVIERRVLRYIGEQGYQDIKENFIPQLHDAGERIEIFETPRGCPNVLNARSYLTANHWMIQRIVGQTGLLSDEADYRRTGERVVHNSARIDPTASLVGPVIVGPGVQIEAGAVVVGPTALGEGTTLGRNVAVSRSVLWKNTTVGDNAVVDGSILSDNAKVAAGARLKGAVHMAERAPQGAMASLRRRAQQATRPRERAVAGLAMSSVR